MSTEQNKSSYSYSPDASSFQSKFESIIADLEREGVDFDETTISYFKKLLYTKFAPEKPASGSRPKSTVTPMDPRLKELLNQGIDITAYSNDELQIMIEMQPTKEERESTVFDRCIQSEEEEDEDDGTGSVLKLRKKLTGRLRNNMFIVGGGAWQNHWEKKKKPGRAARMDEIEEYDEAINKPLEPSHDDLKKSIQPELLKRFSSKIIIMEPMTKQDYLDQVAQFAETLPIECQGLYTKLATEKAEQAHKNMIGMRFFEEILTETLISDMALPFVSGSSSPSSKH